MEFSAQWQAIGREADLAVEQIASGILALSRANHGRKGLYTQAFFGLSIGIERLGKLILIADHAIKNDGSFPQNSVLKKYHHHLDTLLSRCQELSTEYRNGQPYYEQPNDAIHKGIISTLLEFAESTRYYNLDFLSGATTKFADPIAVWWDRVGRPILERHGNVRISPQEKELMRKADSYSTVISHLEDGSFVDNLVTLNRRAKETEVVQRYGRLYSLQIIRWLAYLICDLSHIGGDQQQIEPLFGLWETFAVFKHEDRMFRSRKGWSPYSF